jgi:large subunit ribosomal protein L32
MAVPKRKTSKARRDQRCANWKAVAPTLVECPHCKAQIPPHTVCKECGYYDGKQVIVKKASKEKEKK